MVTKKKAALMVAAAVDTVKKEKTGIEKREEMLSYDEKSRAHQPVNNSLKLKLDHLKTITPLTENQKKFFDLYREGNYCIGVTGSAGTGKTYITLQRGIEEVMDRSNSYRQVVVVRSCVPTRDVGFLPGSLEEKQEVYELPYKEAIVSLFERPDAYDRLKEQGYYRFLTTTAIRGVSIDDAIVIVDECQSMTFHELYTIMTRVGYKSKIIFVGDYRQNDLVTKKNDVSGFEDFFKILRSMREFVEVQFTREDIVRSSLVKSFIIAAEDMGY